MAIAMDKPYEEFTEVDVPDEPTAEAVAGIISEKFHLPTTVSVVATFKNGAIEFDASDIGSIMAVEGRVHGMIRESPLVETIESVRMRSKPWLTDRIDELIGVQEGENVTLHYDSRFGKDVSKGITVTETALERADKPHGYDTDAVEGNIDAAMVFGFQNGDEFSVMAQANGGVNLLMNDTQVLEPGSVPEFVVNDGSDD